MAELAELIAALNEWYDAAWAEPWDAVGLVCGDPGDDVEHVLLAVDPVPQTVDEAIGAEAQLLVTHHPLFLTPVHGVPTTSPKGALVHRMIRAGVAHYVVHTNADVADPGVSDALADALGLVEIRPLERRTDQPMEKIVVFVPKMYAEQLIDALGAAGAGHIGNYDRCAWSTEGTGTFRPGQTAHPTVGEVGNVERVAETRVEMVLPAANHDQVVQAMRSVHPYEEPAFDVFPEIRTAGRRGLGRIGKLQNPQALRNFAADVARALPATEWGVQAAGDPSKIVDTVGVCGGSGASLIEIAQHADVDAYVTADLKHHRAVEAVTEVGAAAMALVDAAHWATEAPWLRLLQRQLTERFDGTGLRVSVSERRTDPWTLHVPSDESSPPAS